MKPGIYRLTAAVENPRGDRRVTRDWYLFPRWAAGTRFYCTVEDGSPCLHAAFRGAHSARNVKSLPPELLAALEPTAPRNVREALRAADLPEEAAYRYLDRMVERGATTYDAIVAEIQAGHW